MGRQNVFLVGLMAVGKSTVGRLLANALDVEFFDTDHVIEERAGAEIAWIFDVEGESGFRVRETRMIEQLTQNKNIVLATGGGAVILAENREWLKARGVVVYLRAPISEQVERTSRDKTRPLLQTPNPEQKIRELMEIRGPLYQEVADMVVDTYRRNPKTVSQEICKHLKVELDGSKAG